MKNTNFICSSVSDRARSSSTKRSVESQQRTRASERINLNYFSIARLSNHTDRDSRAHSCRCNGSKADHPGRTSLRGLRELVSLSRSPTEGGGMQAASGTSEDERFTSAIGIPDPCGSVI